MQKKDIVDKVRFFLHDEKKELWSDDELSAFVDAAAWQYSADAGIFCGSFDIVPDIDGNFYYPENYIHFLCGWNNEEKQIDAISVHDIWDFDREGEIEYIYDDASTKGTFNIYPFKNIKVDHNIIQGDYGVYFDGYGVMTNPADYGTVHRGYRYEYAGNILYCRAAVVEEIQDYIAVVYKALEYAHGTESEFADPGMMRLFSNSYNSRIARFKHNKHKTAGYYSAGIFY